MRPVDLPDRMQAAFIEATGSADDIQVGTLPVPRPYEREVLVRMEASEVNHVDLFVRSGAFPTPMPFPFVIGRDLVGAVVAVGEAVEKFSPGDRVWSNSLGHDGRQGTFSEYVAAPVERLYPLPEGIDPAEVASVLHAAGTAYLGLVREARLRPGETIVVGSASGSVGTAIIQLAPATGAHVIAGASTTDEQWVADCGADVVIDKHAPDYYPQVGQAAPHGLDVCGGMPAAATTSRRSFLCSPGAPASSQWQECRRRRGCPSVSSTPATPACSGSRSAMPRQLILLRRRRRSTRCSPQDG